MSRPIVITLMAMALSAQALNVHRLDRMGNSQDSPTPDPLLEPLDYAASEALNLTDLASQRLSNLTIALNESIALLRAQLLNRTELLNELMNSTRTTLQTGTHLATESLVRPLAFFVGQNLRLFGNGLWSFGHILKHSGYRIANWEPVLQNASVALKEYGQNLVNTYVNSTESN